MKKLPLAAVIATLVSAPVWANTDNTSDSDVTLTKTVTVEKDLTYEGSVEISGSIVANGLGMAVVENVQESSANSGTNYYNTNSSSVRDSSFENASGNIGVNQAAGDNNVQANSAALAEIDASFAFGSGDAEIFSSQQGVFNGTSNVASTNSASLSGNAFKGASGNIGVNIASGNNNAQANNMAAAVSNGRLGEASVSNVQQSGHNTTLNASVIEDTYETVGINLNLGGDGENGGATGTYQGTSEMTSQYYPELWSDADGIHNSGDETLVGHIDFDQSTPSEGAGTGDDNMTFAEMGTLELSGTITGELPMIVQQVKQRTSNTASISGSSFMGASGNIGVNMASGTGNLQANNLSLTTVNSAGVIISEGARN
ncbi:hypothetical protein [Shewanella sp. NIFS-20-20]|uniref:hypothetical protein n=1 Tax=Shewanella sp. NIFS-20-20 TaxID=2853806 RepID=UPI001C497BB0|nr:hypothetical protein [Shewanella sp. NIFS-20-20]MBV7314080.1 hypothetical protein [Shewanella sp. NIFS-20-20]